MSPEEEQEVKNANDLESMLATEGWKVFVDQIVSLQGELMNELVWEDDPDKKIVIQAELRVTDTILRKPSDIVQSLQESRKSSETTDPE